MPSDPAPLPPAAVEHILPGRLRLRVPSRRGDRAFFESLDARLADAPFVLAVRGNAVTGGLLIRHTGSVAELVSYARDNRLFDLRERPTPDLARTLRHRPRRRQPIRPEAVAVAALAGLSAFQLARGRIAGPATENFWNAFRARTALGRPLLSAAFAGLGVYRTATGPRLGSAASLLFYALDAARPGRRRGPV
jgi:hypothetical protein